MPGPKPADLTGETFGKWTVLGFASKTPGGLYYWRCRCECGTESDVRGSAMLQGKSLGCLHCNTAKVTHGGTRGGRVPREYHVWCAMRERCYSPQNHAYPNYGGRGITVCDRWQGPDGFQNFVADMGPRPARHTLDRVDNDGPYGRENCRWATHQQQGRNKRNNRLVTCGGRTLCVSAWAEELGLHNRTLHEVLKAGWTLVRQGETYALIHPLLLG